MIAELTVQTELSLHDYCKKVFISWQLSVALLKLMAKNSHLFPVNLKFGQWWVETALLYMCQGAEFNCY